MERELWLQLYRCLRSLGNPRAPRTCYSDLVIAAVYFWAVLHERPVSWAAYGKNWRGNPPPFDLPSQSTLSRRLRQPSLILLLEQCHQKLAGQEPQQTLVKVIDSKPLPVGAYSHVKDARWGHAARGLLRGYKLHAIYGKGPLPIAWEVVPMNASEQRVARRLFPKLDGGGYVLADSAYDINVLYDLAMQYNHQLLAKRKRPGTGLGNHPQSLHRLHAIQMLEQSRSGFTDALYKLRTSIERRFAQLTGVGGGLAPLPNWVRGLPRVRLWVQAKLLIVAARVIQKQRLVA